MARRADPPPRANPPTLAGSRPAAASDDGAGKATGRRRRAYRSGLSAEFWAAWLLRLKGYRIIGRRVRYGAGEIDLVARRGDVVAFVEVKRRARIEDALEAVTPAARQRIARAARSWVAGHPRHARGTLRFDLVALAPGRLPRHLPSFFEAEV
jgi:putative endonuclease